MARIIQIITLFILSLFMISSSCDKGSEGCTDSNACNYDKNAAINDNSCWFASEGCDCDDPSGSIIDCLGICDVEEINDPPIDSEGNCCASLDEDCEVIVVGGCIDEGNCNYDPNATHNDGSCAGDLSEFGGPILPGAVAGNMMVKTKDSGSGRFVLEDDMRIMGYPVVVSELCSQLTLGAFRQLMLCYWSGLDLLTDPYSNGSSGTINFYALQDVDVGVRLPTAFCKTTS